MKDATAYDCHCVAIAAVGVVFTTLIWPSIKLILKYCVQAYNCVVYDKMLHALISRKMEILI